MSGQLPDKMKRMAKLLNGAELVGYIKERQARQVRSLRQAHGITPRLVIMKAPDSSEVINVYVRLKQRYGEDILIETVVEEAAAADMGDAISRHNIDPRTHGIIVQLPVKGASDTDAVLNRLAPQKDVDGLGKKAAFDSATAAAISWLLAGYGINLKDTAITIVGNGRLVGAPLAKLWRDSGLNVTVLDENVNDLKSALSRSQVIVSAAGVPGLIKNDMVPAGAVVVDAGTTSENGMIMGDVVSTVRERHDITVTPVRGGVGPLTIAMLFDHVIQAAQKTVPS